MPTVQTRPLADGSIRYFVRVRNPAVQPGAKGYFTSATFATEPEANQFVRDVDDRGVAWALSEYHRAQDEFDEMRLDEWAEVHFKALTEPSPETVERYRRIYAADWKPALGSMRLSQLERTHLAAAVNALSGSDKTRLNKWAVLTHMLKMAVQDGHLVRSPAIGVKLGRHTDHEREEHRYLTQGEFRAVLLATPEHWKPLVLLLAGTGMRWSEAAALTVGDVEVAQRTVRVIKATKRDGMEVKPTKSRKSRRTIALPNEVLDSLEPLLVGKRTARIFVPPKGGPLRHRTFYRDIWLKRSVANSGIREPFPRLHDLRHSHVAWLIAAGVSLPVIQARLGHEKITTTIDTYGHLLPDLQRAAAEAADLVLGGLRELG